MDHLTEVQLSAFAQGEMSDDLHADAEAHLADCDVCAEALRRVQVDLPDGWLDELQALQEEPQYETMMADPEAPLDAPNSLVARGPSTLEPHASTGLGRFLPGALLLDRYRIVSALGQGGMGEVYRADDLRLGQPVALKFLSPSLVENESAVQLFHREVALARHVSHPYVCRVHDIGEVEGELFLSMEYIDGEDLDTLLRRIGHLAPGKAMEIAHQLVSGLAAAHDCSVLHRDLKPANVMIDGRGNVRITDFGLACLIDQEGVRKGVVGTPAYMAPEQLLHGQTSFQSDLYSLGLILYEIFTGHGVHRGKSLSDLRREHRDNSTDVLVRLPRDVVDPSVQRIVQRCLYSDPARRPSSVRSVLETLPSANPLASALARGETPSPELVAAGDGRTPLAREFANPMMAILIVLCGLIVAGPFGQLGGLIHTSEFPLKPDVLEHKAREIVRAAKYDQAYTWSSDTGDPFIDSASGLTQNTWFSFSKSNVRASSPFHFWYRLSPAFMVPDSTMRTDVGWENPPFKEFGMVRLTTDLEGRLVYFEAMPPNRMSPGALPLPQFNWEEFLTKERIGIEWSDLQEVEPMLMPPVPFDTHLAWQQISEPDGQPVLIEAAALDGRPVFCRVRMPNEQAPVVPPNLLNDQTRLISLAMLAVATLMAPINLRARRSDQHGAIRVALYFLLATVLLGLVSAHHAANVHVAAVAVMSSIRRGVFLAALMWIYYIALEPYVRRFWPGTLITWSRMLQGQWRDPLVGRDLLIGLTAGAAVHVLTRGLYWGAEWLGAPQVSYYHGDPNSILALRTAISSLLECHLLALCTAMYALMFLFVLRLALPITGIAGIVFVVFHAAQFSLGGDTFVWLVNTVYWVCCLALIVRFGLVSIITFFFVTHCMIIFPMPEDLNAWYVGTSMLPLVAVVAAGGVSWHFWRGRAAEE